jgi:hypothetical protein
VRVRAAIAAGLERAPIGVVTSPGTKNPKYVPTAPRPLVSSQRDLEQLKGVMAADGGQVLTRDETRRIPKPATALSLSCSDCDRGFRNRQVVLGASRTRCTRYLRIKRSGPS